jgi:hypothetical protein
MKKILTALFVFALVFTGAIFFVLETDKKDTPLSPLLATKRITCPTGEQAFVTANGEYIHLIEVGNDTLCIVSCEH